MSRFIKMVLTIVIIFNNFFILNLLFSQDKKKSTLPDSVRKELLLRRPILPNMDSSQEVKKEKVDPGSKQLNEEVQIQKIKALAKKSDWRSENTTKTILTGLASKNDNVSRVAFERLNKYLSKDNTYILYILNELTSNESTVAEGAKCALENVSNEKVIQPLLPYISDKDSIKKAYAIISLAKFKNDQVLEAIKHEVFNDSLKQQEKALKFALGISPEICYKDFIDLLLSDDSDSIKKGKDYFVQYLDVYYDTLYHNTFDKNDLKKASRSLYIIAFTKKPVNLDPVAQRYYEMSETINPENKTYINGAKFNLEEGLKERIYETTSSGWVKIALNTGDIGFNVVSSIHNDLTSEISSAQSQDFAQEAACFCLSTLIGAALGFDPVVHAGTYGAIDNMADASADATGQARSKNKPVLEAIDKGVKSMNKPDLIPTIEKNLKSSGCSKGFKNMLAEGWANIGVAAFPSVITGLEDEKLNQYAQIVLYKMNSEEFIPLFINELKNESPVVKHHSILALGEMNAKDAIPAIEPLVNDSNSHVRKAAKKTLAKLQK